MRDYIKNLSAWDLGMLQDTLSILNWFEEDGITDSRFVRQRIAEYIGYAALQKEKVKVKAGIRKRLTKYLACESCGGPLNYCVYTNAVHCKCGWSRMIDREDLKFKHIMDRQRNKHGI